MKEEQKQRHEQEKQRHERIKLLKQKQKKQKDELNKILENMKNKQEEDIGWDQIKELSRKANEWTENINSISPTNLRKFASRRDPFLI